MTVIKSAIKITSMVALLLLVYTVGEYHGYNLGVSAMGSIAGPALYRCVNLLGGEFGKVRK